MANIKQYFEPRFLAQNGFPGIEDYGFIVGEILDAKYHRNDEDNIKLCRKYPNIFKELEWHQYRLPKEMPAYLKFSNGVVDRVSKWINHGSWQWSFELHGASAWLLTAQPATEDEIIDYLYKKTKK